MTAPDPMTPRPGRSTRPRCTATSRQTGNQCGARAVLGGTVCHWHGGKAPQVQMKARERILAAADPVAAVLVALALDNDTPPPVRLAAVRDLLDRAGEGATRKLEVEHRDADLADLDAAATAWAAAQGSAGPDRVAPDRPA